MLQFHIRHEAEPILVPFGPAHQVVKPPSKSALNRNREQRNVHGSGNDNRGLAAANAIWLSAEKRSRATMGKAFPWLMEAAFTNDQNDQTISVVIELRFSPEELADIDRAATFLQRAAIPGVRDALRMSDILQSLEGVGGEDPIFHWL